MRAQLSVVIPTLNAAGSLASSLPALAEGLTAGLIRELVISDGGSTDQTLLIAEAAGAKILNGAASRGGQLRRGAEAASGEWLLFLHADTILSAGWGDAVLVHMSTGRPAWFPIRFDQGGVAAKIVASWANLRARLFHLPYGDQALLITRQEYESVGGFPDFPLMEDVAMSRSLSRRLVPMPVSATTSADRYLRDGWVSRGARNLSLLVRFLLGADPKELARKY